MSVQQNERNLIKTSSLLNLEETITGDGIRQYDFPWEIIPQITRIILEIGNGLSLDEYILKGDHIWISKRAEVAESAVICGPTIIGHGAQIRHCAFVRGSALVGEGVVVGNSTELKNVLLFNQVQVPHYNYVGDSILGYKSHMGAGAITSNVKSDKTLVVVRVGNERIATGLKKFGAILGDHAEIGCNSVLNPGTIVGRNSNIYPLSMVRGIVPSDSIFKNAQNIVVKKQNEV
jgi:UDP-N-acetylglucosamine diphosphorylase / glucose-1-phosphate thymidylyltransferase / UDP-N-acetylgalactosamine diphosphorylase / glucosamine-1-phosphate N-acetyltransferase / galactosamine-1-phosphate N-acetyltransferase